MRTVLLLIALFLITFSMVAQETTPEPLPTTPIVVDDPSPQEILQAAQNANDRTNDALSRLDTFLSFTQFVGVLLTVVTVIGGVIAAGLAAAGFSNFRNAASEIRADAVNLQDLRHEIDREKKQLESLRHQIDNQLKEINKKVATFESLRDEVQSTLETTQKRLEVSLEEITAHTDTLNQAVAFTQLAQQQISIGNLKAAYNSLLRANEFDEDSRVIQYFMGDILVRLGDLDEALEYLSKAKDEGDYPDAEASYAYATRLKGDRDAALRNEFYAESESIFLKLYKKHPELMDISGESAYGALAGIYRRRGDIDEAILWYERILDVTPLNSYPLNNLGLLNFRKGQTEAAKRYFKTAEDIVKRTVALSPSDYWSWFDLLTAQIVLQDVALADIQERLEQVFELDPGEDPISKFVDGLVELQESPHPPEHIHEIIGWVRGQQKDLDN